MENIIEHPTSSDLSWFFLKERLNRESAGSQLVFSGRAGGRRGSRSVGIFEPDMMQDLLRGSRENLLSGYLTVRHGKSPFLISKPR